MKTYSDVLTAETNQKGVLDIDPIKGCYYGMKKYPNGCYGCCYAKKIASFRGLDFSRSVIRHFRSTSQMMNVRREIKKNTLPFVRMGTFGDPSFDWDHSLRIALFIKSCQKRIVVITKHWIKMTDEQMQKAGTIGVILNTSISALDDNEERKLRLEQYERYKSFGKSVLRIVSCDFNDETETGNKLLHIQRELFKNKNIIDNPLRITPKHPLVKEDIIRVGKVKDLNTQIYMSLWKPDVYVGYCKDCPDMCGANDE